MKFFLWTVVFVVVLLFDRVNGANACTTSSNTITTTETCQEIVGCTNSVDVNGSPISITFTNCVDIGINALQYDVVVCRSVCP